MIGSSQEIFAEHVAINSLIGINQKSRVLYPGPRFLSSDAYRKSTQRD